jgi:hypothetical protein
LTSGLYDSLTSNLWSGTPFATNSSDYFGGDVKELSVNGTTVTGIDGVLY